MLAHAGGPSVDRFAEASAIVQVSSRSRVTAPMAGFVAEILVEPGRPVRRGDPVARLDSTTETIALQRYEAEREAATVRFLRGDANADGKTRLAELRALVATECANIQRKTLHAPVDGRVGDVSVRVGQDVELGQEVVAVTAAEGGATILAMLDARFRPFVGRGSRLRVRFPGLSRRYQDLRVASVSDAAVGPGAVSRYLGQQLGDAVRPEGPTVLVRARLEDPVVQIAGLPYVLGAAPLVRSLHEPQSGFV